MNDKAKDSLETLLAGGLVRAPDDFTLRLLSKIPTQNPANITLRAATGRSKSSLWPSLALAGGALLGAVQVVGFVLGIWIPATAG